MMNILDRLDATNVLEVWAPINDPAQAEIYESLRCKQIADSAEAMVLSIPALARGVAVSDRVSIRSENDFKVLKSVTRSGGHRTLRLVLNSDHRTLPARIRMQLRASDVPFRDVANHCVVLDVRPDLETAVNHIVAPQSQDLLAVEDLSKWVDSAKEMTEPDWLTVQASARLRSEIVGADNDYWIAVAQLVTTGSETELPDAAKGGLVQVVGPASSHEQFMTDVRTAIIESLGPSVRVVTIRELEDIAYWLANGGTPGPVERAAIGRSLAYGGVELGSIHVFTDT